MKALLIEQYHGGHYDNYLATLLPPLLTIANEVVIATTTRVAANSRVIGNHSAGSSSARLTIWPGLPDISPAFSLRDRWTAAQSLRACLKLHEPDQTIISSADPHAMGLALGKLLGQRPLGANFPIDAIFHYGYPSSSVGAKSRMKRMAYEVSQRHCGLDKIGFVNFVVYEDLIARKIFTPERIRLVGDPVPQPALLGKATVRRMFGMQPDDFYLGLLGSIDMRKAVPELLQAFRTAKLGPRYHFVLGGNIAAPHRELIHRAHADLLKDGRLLLIDRHLSELEITHGYEALDLCTPLYYRFPGLASLALKALACKCPLLVDDFGWMGALVRQFKVGTTVPLMDAQACALGLRSAVESAQQPIASESLRRLMAFHSPENFVSHVFSGIYERTGSMRHADSIGWSWVREALE